MGVSFRRFLGIWVCLAIASSAAFGAAFTSVQDGDWSDPATWGNAGSSQPGVTIPGDGDDMHLHHRVTMNASDSYAAGENNAFWYTGGELVQNGGGFYSQGRADLGIGGAVNTVEIYGGYVGFDRVDNSGGPHVFNIYGGEWEYTNTIATGGWASAYLIDGGRMSLGGTNVGSGNSYDLRSGVWDTKFTINTYAGSGNVTWTGGTIANHDQHHDYFQNVVGDMGDESDDVVIDISDQTRSNTARTWNMKSAARDRYGRLNSNGGHIQFDAYSAAMNDCDSIINAADNSILGSGVIFDIGYAGGPIANPSAYVGTTYQLVSMVTNTDFSALTPTVPDATWDDGATTWTVTFQNDVSTDGTVTITSIIPEPATLALLGVSGLVALRRRR